MGKKAKFKKLRRLASQMPGIGVRVVKGEKVTGGTLISFFCDGSMAAEPYPFSCTSLLDQ